MKTLITMFLLAVILLAGCGGPEQTPSTKYVNTATLAADTFEEMAVLIKLGAFDQAQLKQIKFWTDQAKLCLDEWYVNIKADPNAPSANFDATDAYRCVRSSLLKLWLYQDEVPLVLQKQAIEAVLKQ